MPETTAPQTQLKEAPVTAPGPPQDAPTLETVSERPETDPALVAAPEPLQGVFDSAPVSEPVSEPVQLGLEALVPSVPAKPVMTPAANFRITDDDLGIGGPKAKYAANIAAIQTLKAVEAEGRNATPEEQEILSRYVGWGGVPDAFEPDKPEWASEHAELKSLLSDDEYASARASVLNSHYTTPAVIRAIYEALGSMGFVSGNILDESTIRLIQENRFCTLGKVA